MKIAVWHNLPSGGGKRALYDHVTGLVARGHTVESFCPSTADQSYLPLREVTTEHVVPFSWQTARPRNRFSRFIESYRATTTQLHAMDEHCKQIAEQINQGGFDLLFANSCRFFRTTSIGRHVTIPRVIYLQEPYRWLYEALPQLPWLSLPEKNGEGNARYLKNYLHDLVRVQALRVQAREEWQNAKAFDAIIVNSHFSRESVLRAYGIDAKVCYLGIDTEKFHDQRTRREHLIVGIGALVREKNLRFIVEAVSLVRQPGPRLVWIGNVMDEEYVAELKQLASRLGVHFEPKVGVFDGEIVDLLNRAKAMVYAPRLEPFGLAPLEAGACGLPVIAVAEGGVRETVIDGINGLLVDHDPGLMAQAIERVLNDEQLAASLGAEGRRMVHEKWSREGAIDRLESAFEKVLNRN